MCKSTQALPPDPENYRHTCTGCDTQMSGYQCPMHLNAAVLLEALQDIRLFAQIANDGYDHDPDSDVGHIATLALAAINKALPS